MAFQFKTSTSFSFVTEMFDLAVKSGFDLSTALSIKESKLMIARQSDSIYRRLKEKILPLHDKKN